MESESSTASTARALPLSFVFEGQSSLLTTLLHSTIAIWLVVLVTDHEEYFLVDVKRGEWKDELMFYLGCMATATLAAALAVGVLSINLRPVHKDYWRAQSCLSLFALLLVNVLAVDTVIFAIRVLNSDSDKVVSVPATVFVTFIGIAFTLWFNVLYIQLFGFCACFCFGEKAGSKLLEHSQSNDYWHTLPLGDATSTPDDHQKGHQPEKGVLSEIEAMQPPESDLSNTSYVLENDDRTEQDLGGHVQQQQQSMEEERTVETEAVVLEIIQENEADDDLCVEKDVPCRVTIEEPAPSQGLSSLSGFRRWDTVKLVEAGSNKMLKQSSRRRGLSGNRQVADGEPRKNVMARKSLRQMVTSPDVTGIVRKFLRQDEQESFEFSLSKFSLRNLWNSVREEPGHFRYAVWIKSAFLTSLVILLFTHIRTLSMVTNLSELYLENRDRFKSNLDEFNSFLVNAGWLDGIDGIKKTTVIEVYLIIDAIILDLKQSCWVGYSLGLLVGLYSLVAVLIQHKRISLAVSDGLHTFRSEAASRNQEMESPWPAFQKKYPMLGACFFLAILSSTAVVQLHIVGFSVSVLLSLAMNVPQLSVLMNMFGYYLLAYIIVFIIDIIVMRFLESWLISPDGAHIRHPRWFNFIIVVLSMVLIFVLVAFYAMWRLLFAMVTTIITLNRLDVTLFTTGKRMDNGHNAFMSMLVLTVLVQDDQDSSSHRPHSVATSSETIATS